MGKAKKEVHADDDDAIFAQRAIELKGASPQEVPYQIFGAIRAPTAGAFGCFPPSDLRDDEISPPRPKRRLSRRPSRHFRDR